MASNVTPLRTRSDAQRIAAVAEDIRHADCVDSADLADLLAAVATALRSVGRPPMTEGEMWRWAAVVHHARRIARDWDR